MKKVSRDNITMFVINNKALVIVAVLIAVAQISTKGMFGNYSNISSVMRQIAVSGIVGAGFTAVMAGGGIDLSVGNMVSLMGVIYALLTLRLPLSAALLLTVVCGVLCGSFNGVISEKLKLPAFIVTLATAQIFKGGAYLLTDGKVVSGLSDGVRFFGQGLLFGIIPVSMVLMLLIAGLMAMLLYKMKLGRHIIAAGGNVEAAEVSGINVSRTKIMIYVLSGICAAMGAIVLTGRVAIAACAAGEGMEMDIVAAVVIGGTPMSGGKAKVGGTIFGCLVMGIISNLLNLLGISSFWQWVAKGIIIILAIFLDAQTEGFFNKRRNVAQ